MAFVGSNEKIENPRGFRLLVANTIPPTPLPVVNQTVKLSQLGISGFTLLYAEDSVSFQVLHEL